MKAVEEYDFPRDLKGMSLHEKELPGGGHPGISH